MGLLGGVLRLAAGSLLLTALSACGGSSAPGNGTAPGGGNNGYSVPQAARSAAPVPDLMTSSPSAAPMAPPPAAPAPAASLSFSLMPVTAITGTVVFQPMGSSYRVTLQARGMAPGSTHAVHLHFGNCPSAGVHIVALAAITADGAGAGTSTTTVRSAYRGDGRFLIVYAGPNPGPLGACAQLAG